MVTVIAVLSKSAIMCGVLVAVILTLVAFLRKESSGYHNNNIDDFKGTTAQRELAAANLNRKDNSGTRTVLPVKQPSQTLPSAKSPMSQSSLKYPRSKIMAR